YFDVPIISICGLRTEMVVKENIFVHYPQSKVKFKQLNVKHGNDTRSASIYWIVYLWYTMFNFNISAWERNCQDIFYIGHISTNDVIDGDVNQKKYNNSRYGGSVTQSMVNF